MTISGARSSRHFRMSLAGCADAEPATVRTSAAAASVCARSLTALRAGGSADDGGKVLHALDALCELFTAKVEDDLAHAELRERGDVALDVAGRTRERPPLARASVQRLRGIVDRRLVGDGELRRVAAFRLREPAELVERGCELVGAERDG